MFFRQIWKISDWEGQFDVVYERSLTKTAVSFNVFSHWMLKNENFLKNIQKLCGKKFLPHTSSVKVSLTHFLIFCKIRKF